MERLILPLAIPLGVGVFAFLVIFGLSRVLLAVPRYLAPPVALAVAFAILGVSWFLATRPRDTQG